MAQIRLTATALHVSHLDCTDPDVIEFFADVPEPTRPDLACRALALGVVGLRAMGLTGQVKIVEREFLKLSQHFDTALQAVETSLVQRVHATFDPDHAESVSARLSSSISGAHAAGEVITQARADLAALIGDSFNPDLATSCVYRIAKLKIFKGGSYRKGARSSPA